MACNNLKRLSSSKLDVDKGAKKPKSCQQYKESYTKEFPCLIISKLSQSHVFCTLCNADFCVTHGGRDDCRRHIISKKHVDYKRLKEQNKTVSNFFIKDDEINVIQAECYFTQFLIEHNIPLAASDHARPLFQMMFPDSTIAKKYGCGRTKSSAIIQDMAVTSSCEIVDSLKNSLFSIATDGSNDVNDIKLYPLVVTFYNPSLGKIVTLLLSLLECRDNTGEGIFNIIDTVFKKNELNYDNCVSFGCDNASTMVGHFKGVAAFLKQKQPSIIIQGCACHLIHLAAQKASAQLLTQINVETFLLDIYFYMEKSSKRKIFFKMYQALCGQKEHKILKLANTRWLSLLESVNRVLEQWDPLSKFFCVGMKIKDLQKEESANSRFLSVKKTMEEPTTKLYLMFLSNILPSFTKTNVFLQQDAPCVHRLKRELTSLLTDLLVRFVKPSTVSKHATSITDVHFSNTNKQKDDDELVIGVSTKMYMNAKDSHLSDKQIENFYSCVRNFYVAACSYIHKKFPINDEFLKHAEVADISLRQSVSFTSLTYFINLFPAIVSNTELDKLELEFAMYQVDPLEDEILKSSRMDEAWSKISQLSDGNGKVKYTVLPKVMLAFLVIPHSNACSERIFSIVRKNQNEFRPNLSTNTLGALLIEKIKMSAYNETCYKKKFTSTQLKSAKQATRKMLNSKTDQE